MPSAAPPPAPAPCSILLLAGGRGARLGGVDKGLVRWHGRPLIDYLYQAARPFTDDLILSCNRNQDRYAAFADQLVSDATADFPGPLAGVLAGLAVTRHPWLLVLPCDAPRVDGRLLGQLLEARPWPPAPVMVRQAGQWQPMFAVLPTSLTPLLRQRWDEGERSLRRPLLEAGAQALDVAADDTRLDNFNTPDKLAPLPYSPRGAGN